jgi:ribosomal protein S18 acetylase RimI-like enzyme
MPDIQYLPLSRSDPLLLQPLLDDEEKAWMSDLSWDYSPIRRILVSFLNQKLLPGYVAVVNNEAVAYSYFLVNQARGTIGAIFASRTTCSGQAVEEVLSLSVSSLIDSPGINRIEAQIMPFNDLSFTAGFARHGFSHHRRYFMQLDLLSFRMPPETPVYEALAPWESANLARVAEMTSLSYRDQADAILSLDYRTREGCETYLRSLVENPGCGIFMPDASFMALDDRGYPRGFIISCRISSTAGMIPQIAVEPGSQNRGLGNALIRRAFEGMKSSGIHTVSLTVTAENRRAFEWYQRLGFKIWKEFGAYVWQK